MTLGHKIQEIRNARGMSQEEFGEMLGTTRQIVSKWELNQASPDIKKIVAISKLFCVPTDELLLGVTNFENEGERFVCGVFRKDLCEIVETEKVLLEYYGKGKDVLGAKAYTGNGDTKILTAVCERNCKEKTTFYAFSFENEKDQVKIISNNPEFEALLGERFERERLSRMKRLESFIINHGDQPRHAVHEIGIRQCLSEWRKGTEMSVTSQHFRIQLCTEKTEYVFIINKQNTDIYCGCSYNLPFELGLKSYGQFFRIRNYKDNTEGFCNFYYDFDYQMPKEELSVCFKDIKIGQAVNDSSGMYWFVKSYSEAEIVLAGCGGDEYIYRKDEPKLEYFM